MDKPLVSIVIPVYNAAKYLERSIGSVRKQTYENLEIICVDDGSKDESLQMLNGYAAEDPRIKVIHKTNGGLVSARKSGLKESKGEYITYVDGDDWIGPDLIGELYKAAVDNDADMVCAGFTRELFSKSATFTNYLPSGIYEGEKLKDLWKSMASFGTYYRPGISTYVWNKLFKRGILTEPQLGVDDRIGIGEDAAVTYPALLNCSRVAVIDNTSYHYRQREDSMLKQSSGYSNEAQKLKYLFDYLTKWSDRTDRELGIKKQVIDYILSIAIMRSGGRLPHEDYSPFDPSYYGKDVVVYSAGTFGQQLVKRFGELNHCRVVSWIDDDYWEYRRCCLDVDPVESISDLSYDYILIATVDSLVAGKIKDRLTGLGADGAKILTVAVPEDREDLLNRFLDVDAIAAEEKNR